MSKLPIPRISWIEVFYPNTGGCTFNVRIEVNSRIEGAMRPLDPHALVSNVEERINPPLGNIRFNR